MNRRHDYNYLPLKYRRMESKPGADVDRTLRNTSQDAIATEATEVFRQWKSRSDQHSDNVCHGLVRFAKAMTDPRRKAASQYNVPTKLQTNKMGAKCNVDIERFATHGKMSKLRRLSRKNDFNAMIS